MLSTAQLTGRYDRENQPELPSGIARRDVSGEAALDFASVEQEFALDVDATSVGADLGSAREVYAVTVTPRGAHGIGAEHLEVYLANSNRQGSWTRYADIACEIDDDGVILIRFEQPQSARFVKLHCLIDDRGFANESVGTPQVRNDRDALVTVFSYVNTRIEDYTYDARGMRESLTVSEDGTTGPTRSYTYYPGSDLLRTDGRYAYTYDANGNLVAKGSAYDEDDAGVITIRDEGQVWEYVWDAFGRLAEVRVWDEEAGAYRTAASYRYDYRGFRIAKTDAEGAVTRYAYDREGRLVVSAFPDGSSEELVWLSGVVFARVVRSPREDGGTDRVCEYYGTDHQGTTIFTTDEEGSLVSTVSTGPFGINGTATGTVPMAMLYTGKDKDPDTGLYYYNARWMDPETGKAIPG